MQQGGVELIALDWAFIFGFFAAALVIGVLVARKAGTDTASFFLSGRGMPWWLLGFSMVATTFSTDTPNLVTDFVRADGVAGNWRWWAFLLTGMLTVFLYAKLWRRSNVLTDIEFYELRYGGKSAAFLRGFRAIYLGVFFNIMIMAGVTLAAVKIGGIMLGLSPLQTILIAGVVTVIFSTAGGFRSVVLTDFILFIIAMIGAVAAAVFALKVPEVGGLSGLLSHPEVEGSLNILPAFDVSNRESLKLLMTLLIIPVTVQWWSVWYPGSEPGGGGYLAQRMLAARDEKHATGAVLFFNAAHYALRPWPWILVALASLVVFPKDSPEARRQALEAINAPAMVEELRQLSAAERGGTLTEADAARLLEIKTVYATSKGCRTIYEAFPATPLDKIGHDLGYSAMLTFVPHGWIGLIMASLIAAYMSTISTHLNWGSSYVVNDWYRRFQDPDASEKTLVLVGRVSTVVLMIATAIVALWLQNAVQLFEILLQVGAGTGLLFILRWFWWRINAISEIVAMVVSFLIAVSFKYIDLGYWEWLELPLGVALTTVCWVAATYMTKPTDDATLRRFIELTHPGGRGWQPVVDRSEAAGIAIRPRHDAVNLPTGILCMVLGCLAVYGALFGIGSLLYGRMGMAVLLFVIAAISTIAILKLWDRVIER
jgi:Na+/proline symporter